MANYQALWTVPASPYASMQGALNGIRFAREHQVPFLGTCGGFQHMIIEFARNMMGLYECSIPSLTELFQPERSAFNKIVHPLIKAFLQATIK